MSADPVNWEDMAYVLAVEYLFANNMSEEAVKTVYGVVDQMYRDKPWSKRWIRLLKANASSLRVV